MDSMTPDAPEYHTKTLSPLSPLPVHPPEPSNVPVLRNQIDPILNMTSTFDSAPGVPGLADSSHEPNSTADSPSAESSFSDAYRQTDGNDGNKNLVVNQGTEAVSDDYAMTFDSDGEALSDSQDVSQANTEQTPPSLSASVPTSHIPSSVTHDSHIAALPQNVQDNSFSDSNFPPAHPPTTTANPSESNPDETQAETAKPQTQTYEEIASGGIDIQQLLDNITANAEKNEATSALTTPSPAIAPSLPKTSGLPTHSSLPPRPQLPAKPFLDDIHKYHAGVAQPSHTYRTAGMNIVASGAPGTSTDPRSGLPPPPVASFRSPQPAGSPTGPTSPGSYQLNRLIPQDRTAYESQAEIDDANVRWGLDMQKKYDEFLVRERQHVTDGMWGNFPVNSRLFIGNLPSEKVTKRDVFHIFHKYGDLAQIAIKQAYGFVQFNTADACFAALEHEQGVLIRDKKMHLEISKPQKNTRNVQGGNSSAQRTRSPDYGRGATSDRGSRQGQVRGSDRYDGRPNPASRNDEYGRPLRDDYRSPTGRPASPLQDHIRNHDYTYNRGGRDSYDGRARRRSRSRSPSYGQRDRYRQRSPSPRTSQANDDADLQIPRRAPFDTPDVQIILIGQLDRNFISWVEDELRGRGLKTEVMFLSPRLSLEAVIRRQILEGVHAVSQLDMRAQNSSKIPLQVFDRQAGNNNVRFNEYQDLEPKIAAELVLRTKQTEVPTPTYAQAPTPTYAQPQIPSYAQPPAQAYAPPQPQYAPLQQYQQLSAASTVPDLANLVGQLDNATLQKLLGSMSAPPQPQNVPAAVANPSIDLTSLLSGLKPQPQPQPTYQPPSLVPADSYAGYQNGAAQQQPAPQQSAQQVQNIMAQLAKFRQ